jgi:hypothetical protein
MLGGFGGRDRDGLYRLMGVTEKDRCRLEDEKEKVAHLLVVIETVRLHSVADVTVLLRLVETDGGSSYGRERDGPSSFNHDGMQGSERQG